MLTIITCMIVHPTSDFGMPIYPSAYKYGIYKHDITANTVYWYILKIPKKLKKKKTAETNDRYEIALSNANSQNMKKFNQESLLLVSNMRNVIFWIFN